MNLRPKKEPGSPPRNLKRMSVSELVSVLRTAFSIDDFDRVQEVLVAREARLKSQLEEKVREIGSLQEKIEWERMNKLNVEEQLKRCKEESEKGKRAQGSYEKLLKEVKKSGLDDKNTINEVRKKNRGLEGEILELEEMKKKWVDDKNAVDELKIKTRELEEEKLKLEAQKKDWQDDTNTIAELRTDNRKLADEKREAESLVKSREKKLWELNERVLRLENDFKLLMSADADAPGGGNAEVESQADPGPGVTFEARKEKEMTEMDVHGHEFGNYTAGSASLKRNEDISHCFGQGTKQSPSKTNKDALGASARGKLELGTDRTIIEIKDSDDDECISQGALHGKVATSRIVADNEHPSSLGAVQQKKLSKGVEAIEML